jgi:hypothetical protein
MLRQGGPAAMDRICMPMWIHERGLAPAFVAQAPRILRSSSQIFDKSRSGSSPRPGQTISYTPSAVVYTPSAVVSGTH